MKKKRDNGLDTLKAVSIIFVLFWHLKPLRFDTEINQNALVNIPNFLVDSFNLQVCLTAVPVFFIVSLYLFFVKIDNNESYLKIRLWHVCKIFIFWSLAQIAISYLISNHLPVLSWQTGIKILLGIEPSLPFVGKSVFYYLFNLIILTGLAFFYQKLNSKYKEYLSYVIVLLSLVYFEVTSLLGIYIPSWRLDNFFVCIPISFLLISQKRKIFNFRFYYLFIYFTMCIHDVYLRINGYTLSTYGRISIIFGALTIFCFIYPLSLKKNWFIQQLSNYSLGLYALHKYWQYIFIYIVQGFEFHINILAIELDIMSLVGGIIITFLTFITIYLLRLTSLRQFVG